MAGRIDNRTDGRDETLVCTVIVRVQAFFFSETRFPRRTRRRCRESRGTLRVRVGLHALIFRLNRERARYARASVVIRIIRGKKILERAPFPYLHRSPAAVNAPLNARLEQQCIARICVELAGETRS